MNTQATYITSLKAFDQFRTTYNFPLIWPVTDKVVILFITFCFESGLAPSTISTYIAGVNYLQKIKGGQCLFDMFIVKKTLEGCHRSRNKVPDPRDPITRPILKAICQAAPNACYNIYESTLFQALFSVAYFGLFRVSELVATNPLSPNSGIQYPAIKVDTSARKLIITLNVFKTNQHGLPIQVKIPCEPSPPCPLEAIQRFLARRPAVSGPFFCHADGKPVTRYQFNAVLQKCLYLTEFSSSHFRTHSFRIGRATDLATQGVTTEAIMELGRWKSTAYKSYIR